MRNGIVLNEEEQKSYCDRLTAVLAELRKRLGQTQEEMESTSGISRLSRTRSPRSCFMSAGSWMSGCSGHTSS